jgi:hypothetical protein
MGRKADLRRPLILFIPLKEVQMKASGMPVMVIEQFDVKQNKREVTAKRAKSRNEKCQILLMVAEYARSKRANVECARVRKIWGKESMLMIAGSAQSRKEKTEESGGGRREGSI